MEFRKEDMLDLNEQNVQRLFAYCLANDQTDPKNVVKANFFEKPEIVNIPTMKFDKSKVSQIAKKVCYMLGQLRALHIGTANMIVTDGFQKYDGTSWTQNKVALFALYYLGDVSAFLPKFEYFSSLDNYASPLTFHSHLLRPTISPNDPNFK